MYVLGVYLKKTRKRTCDKNWIVYVNICKIRTSNTGQTFVLKGVSFSTTGYEIIQHKATKCRIL